MDLTTLIGMLKIVQTTEIGKKVSNNLKNGKVLAGKRVVADLSTINNLSHLNSIKGMAKKSIAQYPVLISENVGSKVAPVLVHGLEVENATLVAMILKNSATYTANSAGDVLNTFHNRKNGLVESTFMCGCDSLKALDEANTELMTPYEDILNETTINESYYNRSMMVYLEAKKSKNAEERIKRKKEKMDLKKAEDDARRKQKDEDRKDYEWNKKLEKEREDEIKKVKDEELKKDEDRDVARKRLETIKRTGVKVTTNAKDISKLNDMQPTILDLEVNFIPPKDPEDKLGTSPVITKEISIGVKCISHLLKAEDIEYYLTKASYKDSPLLKLIKWTTGEISFWKGLVFAIDDIKMDAIQQTKKSSKSYLSRLEFIAKQSKALVAAGSKVANLPTAITTLIISTVDVENIKYRHGINILSKPEYLKKIHSGFHLLNFLIVDEALDVVYMYEPTSNSIETIAISSYEKVSKERKIDANDLYKLLK